MKVERVYSKRLKQYLWRLDFTIDGHRLRLSDLPTRQKALEAYASILERRRAARFGTPVEQLPITLGQLLEEREADLARKHQVAQLATFRGFVEFAGRNAELRLMKKKVINDWMDDLRQRELANTSIQTYLAYVMSALHSASDYFPDFEWQPPRIKWPKADPGRDRVLTSEEIARLLAGFRADRQKGEHQKSVENRRHVLDLFRLALLVPARESELMALTTADVNTDWNTMTVFSKKNNTRRVLPLCATALEILRGRWPKEGKEFFPGFYSMPLVAALKRTAEIAGVTYGDQIEGAWVFHDLRHTAATVMAGSNIDHATIAMVLGHKRQSMTDRYINPSLDSQRKAIRALEDFCLTIEGFSGASFSAATPERIVSGF